MLFPFTKTAHRRWTQEEVELLKEEILQGRSLGESFKDIYVAIADKLGRSTTEVERKLIRLYRTDDQLKALKQEDWSRAKILDQVRGLYLNNQPINKNHLPNKLKYILLKVVPPAAPSHRCWFKSVDHALAEAVFSCKYPRLEDGNLDYESPLNSFEEALKYIRLGHKKRHAWSLEEIKQILTELNDADYPITLPFLANHYDLYKGLININRKLESLRDVIKKFIDDGQIQSYADLVCGIAPDYAGYYSDDRSRLRLSTEEIRVKKFLDRFQIPYVIPRLSDKIQTGLPDFNNFVPDFILVDSQGAPLAIVEVFGSIGDRENAGVSDIYNNKTKAKIDFYKSIPNLKFIEIYNNNNRCDLDDDSLFDRFGSYIQLKKEASLKPFTKKAEEALKSKLHIDEDGNKYWHLNGAFHREDGPAVEYANGTKFWYSNGKCHREDGPAIESVDGYEWHLNGKLHRVDGPAVINANGNKFWYLNSRLHREDDPAIEYANGTKAWYLDGKLHREDGPAVELENGSKHWYLNGKRHRVDGPAIESIDGYEWYSNDKLHRMDGPAIESDEHRAWFINGKQFSDPKEVGKSLQDQYNQLRKSVDLVEKASQNTSFTSKFPFKVVVTEKSVSYGYQPVILLLPTEETKQKLGEEVWKEYQKIETHRDQNEICHARIDIDEENKTWYIIEIQSDKLAGASSLLGEGTPKAIVNRIRNVFHDWKYILIDVIKQLAKKQDPNNKVLLSTSKAQKQYNPGLAEQKAKETYDAPGEKLKLERVTQIPKILDESSEEGDGEFGESSEGEEFEFWKVASLEDLVTSSFLTSQSNLQKYGCSILYNSASTNKPYNFIALGEQDLRFDSLLELPLLTPKNKALKSIIDRIMEKQKYRFTSPLNPVEQQKDYKPRSKPIDNESERGLPISYQEPRFR